MSKLAILGGKPSREKPFPAYSNFGDEETEAVVRVMKSRNLSRYQGGWGPDFFGGPEVQAFEKEWSEYFGAKHSVAVNSNTSGLQAALGACGIGPGDEVIVTPFSICISATAPLFWNATPVFADIDAGHYCLSVEAIRRCITSKTKAIVVVHIFGCPADMDEIMMLAKEHGLYVIEDCAQSPGARYKEKMAGTLGHVGVFSLNYHKHIHTGEGGVCVTNDDRLARRMQLIRNHAEAVVEPSGETDLVNMLGCNFRLTELQAAIGRVQLSRLSDEVKRRQSYARAFTEALSAFDFIGSPDLTNRTHSYYVQPFQYDQKITGVTRDRFIQALKAELPPFEGYEHEGAPVSQAYVKPLYMLPLFQKRVAYKGGYPFNGKEKYEKGTCPVAEDMHFNRFWSHRLIVGSLTENDVSDGIAAIKKVCNSIHELRA